MTNLLLGIALLAPLIVKLIVKKVSPDVKWDRFTDFLLIILFISGIVALFV